jgi:hypothetical protein
MRSGYEANSGGRSAAHRAPGDLALDRLAPANQGGRSVRGCLLRRSPERSDGLERRGLAPVGTGPSLRGTRER